MSRSIRISDELWQALKMRSVQLKVTLQAVTEEAAGEYLERHQSASVAAVVQRARAGSDVVEKNAAIVPRLARGQRKVATPSPELTKTLDKLLEHTPVTSAGSVAERLVDAARRLTDNNPVCVCGHSAAAHVDLTGRCQFGTGCAAGCREFQADGDF